MTLRRAHRLLFASQVAVLAASAAAAEGPQELRHNPFSRPASERTITEPDLESASGTSGMHLDLRATMVASHDKLANVGGRTLRPGDDVQGYRLLQVFEDRAVFVREGKALTIYVKPKRMDDDD